MYTKRLERNINLLCVILLIPFIGASNYVHPSADDYSYAVLALKEGSINAQLTWYNEWSGRYSATALISFSPLYFGHRVLYKLAPLLWLLLTWGSIFLFLKALFPSKSTRIIASISLWIHTFYICFMPEPTEGIYWYAGASTYQGSLIIALLVYAQLVNLMRVSAKKRSAPTLLAALAAFFLVGFNETMMVMHLVLLSSILIITIYYQIGSPWPILVILFSSLIGAGIVYFAPGNTVRISHFPTSQKVLAFGESLLYSGFLFWKWLLVTPLLFTLLMARYSKSFSLSEPLWKKILEIPPFICWGTYFFTMYLGTFVGFWSLGFRPPPRTLNVIYFVFILGLLFNVYHSFQFFSPLKKANRIPSYAKILIGIFILGYLFSPANNALQTGRQILSGKLKRFDEKMQKRYTRLEKDPAPNIVVEQIPETNENVVFYTDITPDSSNWANKDYAWYFRKESVVLKDSTNL